MKRVWVLPGILLPLVLFGLAVFFWPTAEADSKLKANAGPDQIMPQSKVEIIPDGRTVGWIDVNGCDSEGDIAHYAWYNQWGQQRDLYGGDAPRTCNGELEVNFGQNPQPGTQRLFTLVVTDQLGNSDHDSLTVTLGEPEEDNPPARYSVTGTAFWHLTQGERTNPYGPGATIRAYIDEQLWSENTTDENSGFILYFTDTCEGKEVTFTIDHFEAVQTTICRDGQTENLDLDVLSPNPRHNYPPIYGETSIFGLWGFGGPSYDIDVGLLDNPNDEQDFWYVSSGTSGEDIFGFPAPITCHFGEYFEYRFEPTTVERVGCWGEASEEYAGEPPILLLDPTTGNWVVIDDTGERIVATIDPKDDRLYIAHGSNPW